MTTYEKYLQWKAEQTSKAPSIKAFCEWLDNPNKPEMIRQDEFGKIADLGGFVIPCSICVYDELIMPNYVCNYCADKNKDSEYYYAKPD